MAIVTIAEFLEPPLWVVLICALKKKEEEILG